MNSSSAGEHALDYPCHKRGGGSVEVRGVGAWAVTPPAPAPRQPTGPRKRAGLTHLKVHWPLREGRPLGGGLGSRNVTVLPLGAISPNTSIKSSQ